MKKMALIIIGSLLTADTITINIEPKKDKEIKKSVSDCEQIYGGRYDLYPEEDFKKFCFIPTKNGFATLKSYMPLYCDISIYDKRGKLLKKSSSLIKVKVKGDHEYTIFFTKKNDYCKYLLVNFP